MKPISLIPLRKIPVRRIQSDMIDLHLFKTMTHDVDGSNYTILTGPITRAGSFDYYKNGKKITVFKDWDNIKEISKNYDYIPIRATVNGGSHFGKIEGFAHNFQPREDTQELFAELVLLDDIRNLTTVVDPEEGYHMSLGFEDEFVGDKQVIKSFDHVAISLDNSEKGRCTTGRSKGGATSCTAHVKKIYDQNLNNNHEVKN